MKSRILAACILGALVTSTIGCTAVARTTGGWLDSKYAKPRSGTEWVAAPPNLEPPTQENKTIYISHRNLSDIDDMDIKAIISNAAQSEGWRVVSTPAEATYRLRGETRFFGEVEPGSGGVKQARTMGIISGAVGGGAAGLGTYALTDSGLASVGVGGAVGGFTAIGMTNASTPREWALIVDWVLEEKLDQPTTFDVATRGSSDTNNALQTNTTRSTTGGGQQGGNTSVATNTRTSDYFPHGVRLSSWANQMNMQEEEAVPHITERVEKVVKAMLPQ